MIEPRTVNKIDIRSIGRLSLFALLLWTLAVPIAVSAKEDSISILEKYRSSETAQRFESSLRTFGPKEPSLRKALDALYFVDLKDSIADLLNLYAMKSTLEEVRFPHSYDHPQEPAFESFRQALQIAKSETQALNVDRVTQLHKQSTRYMTHDGEAIGGVFRKRFVYGPEFEKGLTAKQIATVNQSPYLFFMPSTSIYADRPLGVDSAKIGDSIRGAFVYPRPRDIKPQALALLHATHPDVVRRVVKYQKKYGRDWQNHDHPLTRDLISALTEERVLRLEKDIDLLGADRDGNWIEKYTKLISDFQKDFVAIHPFQDGNGRTSRLLLYHLAARAGLPLPWLARPNDDLYRDHARWTELVRDGMVVTAKMQSAVIERRNQGLPIEGGLQFISSFLPKRAADQRFAEFLRLRLNQDADLSASVKTDPVAVIKRIKNEYRKTTTQCGSIFQ